MKTNLRNCNDKNCSEANPQPAKNFYGNRNKCRSCYNRNCREWNRKNLDRRRGYSRKWLEKDGNREKKRLYNRSLSTEKKTGYTIKCRYGVAPEGVKKLLLKQRGTCAICKKRETAKNPRSGKPRSLSVDHCHRTGAIRGLLCSRCNMMVGLSRESISTLKTAIKYLEK